MPSFPRDVLAKFLPQRHIPAFEKLNTAVDVDLPDATAAAQATADEARLLALIARANSDVLRPALAALEAAALTQRSDRALIASLERRVADLEARLLALQRNSDVDQLRRQLADLQALQTRR
jgi:polyhydroxyalkanoate synthesis regulator phasin